MDRVPRDVARGAVSLWGPGRRSGFLAGGGVVGECLARGAEVIGEALAGTQGK